MGDNAEPGAGQRVDTGLVCLVLMLRFLGVPADPAQLRHRIGNSAELISTTQILRTAKDLALKAKVVRSTFARLAKSPLPAIAALKDAESAAKLLVLPPLNEMIDITTTRAMMLETHTPPVVLAALLYGAYRLAIVLGFAASGAIDF